jgi:transcriptional regulator with XRE-family HTH domain
MTKYNSFNDLFADLKKDDSYWIQKALIGFSVELSRLMDKRGITKKEFAEKIDSSKAYVTKVFRGNANFTIETMVKLARALDGNISLHITPKEESTPNWYRAIDGKLKRPTFVPASNWGDRFSSEVFTDTKAADYQDNIAEGAFGS